MHYTPKTRPFRHQSTAVVRAVRARNFALFMEPRTGKTKAAIDYVGVLALKGEVRRVLVLCPLIAIDVWVQQLALHTPYPYSWETATHEHVNLQPGDGVAFYLMNYEKVSRRVRKKSGGYSHPYVEELERWRPDVVICDESHKLKRSGGVASQSTWRMVRRLRGEARKPYVLLLTGTPNPKGWIDLFAQFRVMDESIFGTARELFEEEYCVYGMGSRRFQVVRYRQVPQLLAKVRAHSFAITAEQAGLANEQFTQNLLVTLPPTVKAKYNELADELVTEIGGESVTATNAGVKRLRLLQITGGFTTRGFAIHRAKLTVLKEYLTNLLEQGESAIVYCRFTPEVLAAGGVSKRVGYETHVIHGSIPGRDRTAAVAEFQSRTSPSLLVFQNQVGSLSIELTAAAEVIFYSLPDSWDNYFQARSRVLGPNQHRPVRFTHLLARGTVDRSVLQGLTRKEDQHAMMMQSPHRYLFGVSESET